MDHLTIDDIKKRIPHRHENLLLDSVDSDPDTGNGEFQLDISPGDPLGRDVFIKHRGPNEDVIIPLTAMEILALASIAAGGNITHEDLVFYAAIKNFKLTSSFPVGQVNGSVKRLRDKGAFIQYHGELRVNDTMIASGDMVAFHAENIDLSKKSLDPSEFTPNKTLAIDVDKTSRLKSEFLYAADRLIDVNDTEKSCVAEYTYPTHHPFIRGHFPHWPVMMGIMQMMSVEDALATLASYKKMSGVFDVRCDATIYNQDGHVITHMFGIHVDIYQGQTDVYDQAEMKGAKKISFKNMVRPGDTIYTVISNISIS